MVCVNVGQFNILTVRSRVSHVSSPFWYAEACLCA